MISFTAILEKSHEIEQALGYVFKNKQLLATAFVHRSFFNESRDLVSHHNERLEFLGDSVLGLVISEYLFAQLPLEEEGALSQLRSQMIDAPACAHYVQKIGMDKFVLLGRGERMNEGKGRETILADLFEALMGAIYLDGGFFEAKRFFFHHFTVEIERAVKEPIRNWKAELQDFSQKKYQKPPVYKVFKETGPDHSKTFHVEVYIEDLQVGQGMGSSKKEAEIDAAQNALKKLKV